ncbi:hypothetical protein E2C01_035146 [Portunus trituberculatus]|uniref:Uncharacterized protein n=1 Tax=Portunus trituberculatus TaxID=210409 RepID=A0A5B7F7N5_PORTR|nr:hypothetical protein [Portunus trituberculatus]
MMAGISLLERRQSEEKEECVEYVKEKAGEAQLRHFGQEKTGEEDEAVKAAMKAEVRGRRSVGRPRIR